MKKNKKYNTLFLDRDGVINKKIENGYVLSWNDFVFENLVKENFKKLNTLFEYAIVVTNQKCVGKNLISEIELLKIHEKMRSELNRFDGKIDKIYFCPSTSDLSSCRKPNDGMFLAAKKDNPKILLNNLSVMIGDSITDLIPAKKNGLITIFLSKDRFPEVKNPYVDFIFPSLSEINWELI